MSWWLGCSVRADPFQLDDWLSEEDGRVIWPMTLYPDIFNFLRFYPTELESTDLNNYNTSKGHSYYAKGWLGDLEYHGISAESLYCFLKGDYRKSEKLRNTFYKL